MFGLVNKSKYFVTFQSEPRDSVFWMSFQLVVRCRKEPKRKRPDILDHTIVSLNFKSPKRVQLGSAIFSVLLVS